MFSRPPIVRLLARTAAVTLSALGAACSDPASSALTAPVVPDARAIVHATTTATRGDTVVQTFTVAPGWSDSYVIDGMHRVDVEAHSICDPRVSTYGPTEWDKPCTAITQPLKFTAKSWTDDDGHPRVSFSPDVRFVPGKVNTLTLKDKSSSSALAAARIKWCPTDGTSCIDEAINDLSLKTQLNPNGTLSRRVKHFSGYTVTAD